MWHEYYCLWPGLPHLWHVWLYAEWGDYGCLWPMLPHLFHRMALRRTARALLRLAWVSSSLIVIIWLYPYGESIIAFGLGYLIFAIVWLYVIWREHYCFWPGLIHLCYHVAVPHMARVLLPLAWATSSLPSYGCTSYGASIIAFGLG